MKRSKKVIESEIVESLLSGAQDDLKTRVSVAADTDRSAAALHQQWTEILQALKSEQEVYTRIQERAIDTLNTRALHVREEHEQPAGWGRPSAGYGWPLRLAGAATVMLGITIAAILTTRSPNSTIPSTLNLIPQPAVPSASNLAQHVRFDFAGQQLGTELQPFVTLNKAAESVPAGGVVKIKAGTTSETLRIAKPVRLVAVNGKVSIGAT